MRVTVAQARVCVDARACIKLTFQQLSACAQLQED